MDLYRNNYKALYLFFLLSGVGTAFCQEGEKASLHIHGSPDGLPVFIDGGLSGRTPVEIFCLAPGRHTILVPSPLFGLWPGSFWQREITIREGGNMNLPVEFPHRLWLTSHPAEAEVWKGDKLLGLTPILLDQRLYSGSGFRLSHEGYADTLLSSRLIKNRSYLLAELHRKHPGSGSPTISSRVGTWLWRGAGAAVLLGTAGYICQKRADKAYSNYLRTGHQGRMNQEYDRAVHYDKLTGIFYVAGEISLGVTLYFAVEKIW